MAGLGGTCETRLRRFRLPSGLAPPNNPEPETRNRVGPVRRASSRAVTPEFGCPARQQPCPTKQPGTRSSGLGTGLRPAMTAILSHRIDRSRRGARGVSAKRVKNAKSAKNAKNSKNSKCAKKLKHRMRPAECLLLVILSPKVCADRARLPGARVCDPQQPGLAPVSGANRRVPSRRRAAAHRAALLWLRLRRAVNHGCT